MTDARALCVRCRTEEAHAIVRQREKLCPSCLEDVLHLRVKSQMRRDVRLDGRERSRRRTTDRKDSEITKLAVACSGGFSSTAMISILAEVQTTYLGRSERGRISFTMEAIVVDEGCLRGEQHSDAPDFAAQVAAGVDRIVREKRKKRESFERERCISSVHPPFRANCVRLEDVFVEEPDSQERKRKCRELVHEIKDATGREDLVRHLRLELLRQEAIRMGADALLLGESATRLAVNAISDVVKGRGYAIPAGTRFTDNRMGRKFPTILRPMRDSVAKELALFCHYQGLNIYERPKHDVLTPTLNQLSDDFIATLQANLPSSASTIFRTVEKLQAFSFNADEGDEKVELPEGHENDGEPDSALCCICKAPLAPNELEMPFMSTQSDDEPKLCTCRSCYTQIAGGEQQFMNRIPVCMQREAHVHGHRGIVYTGAEGSSTVPPQEDGNRSC